MTRTLSAAAVLLAATAVAADKTEPSEKVRKYIGNQAVEYLLRVERVEAFRVGNLDADKAGRSETVGGRAVSGEPVVVDRATANKLVAALLADDTYFRGDSKGTKTGVGYRIWTDKKECVEVSCCLTKGNVWIVVKDADGKVVAKGDRRGFRDDPASPMRAIAAEIFPNDGDVQKLRPKADGDAPKADVKPKAGGKAESGPFEPAAKVEKLAGGFGFTEGPAADAEGNVYFTDQPSDRILKWSTDGKLSTFLEKCGRSNGLCFDKDGKLWACADEKNELWKIDPATKKHTVMVSDFGGKLLNGPNDVWVRPAGGVYFTDPFYKRKYWNRGPEEQDKKGLYFLAGDGKVSRIDGDFKQPNGVVGSLDGKTLFVADIGGGKTYQYPINDDGTLGQRKLFCDAGSDGMTTDADGNVYLTGAGVLVFDKAGKKVTELAVPERPSNVCFGGKDGTTLFITARTALYAIPTRVKGSRQ